MKFLSLQSSAIEAGLHERPGATVMPVIGSDLLLMRADGSAQQDVRVLLKTDDEALVLMTYRGVRHASDDVNARIARANT